MTELDELSIWMMEYRCYRDPSLLDLLPDVIDSVWYRIEYSMMKCQHMGV